MFVKTPVNVSNIDPSHQPIPSELQHEEESSSSPAQLWLNSLQFRETSIDFLSLADQVKVEETFTN